METGPAQVENGAPVIWPLKSSICVCAQYSVTPVTYLAASTLSEVGPNRLIGTQLA